MHQKATRLTPRAAVLLRAYSEGVFPMADSADGEIGWYLPERRGIIPLDRFHTPTRLRKTIRQERFQVTVNRDFGSVIRACAEPGANREDTWISDDIVDAYEELHGFGFAHSVEVWQERALVGGLYGVSFKGLFAGESMFSRVRDASKIALVYLAERLIRNRFCLLDTQFYTPHLGQFGAVEIDNVDYQILLARALSVNAIFDPRLARPVIVDPEPDPA